MMAEGREGRDIKDGEGQETRGEEKNDGRRTRKARIKRWDRTGNEGSRERRMDETERRGYGVIKNGSGT